MQIPMCLQRGVAAVEMAIVLLVVGALLTMPVFFARYFWCYTVAQKAAQDAARFMSTVPLVEIKSAAMVAEAVTLAKSIAQTELSELGLDMPATVQVECDQLDCYGYNLVPTEVRVTVRFQLSDTFFGKIPTGDTGKYMRADASLRYVGN